MYVDLLYLVYQVERQVIFFGNTGPVVLAINSTYALQYRRDDTEFS
jgi:hypothetical protein